jgi:hypothetical protein
MAVVSSSTPKAYEMITSLMPEIHAVYDALELKFGKVRLGQLLIILEELSETGP